MKINRGRELNSVSERREATFTGDVWADPVLSGTEDVTINNVFFAPAGRTHWHTHNGPQILVVIGGQGSAFTRDGEGGEIRAGDVVYIPAGEEHWHGANPGSYLLHTAITVGGHDWLDPVSDDDYNSVTSPSS
ncbi:MAG TPA: cupin domain-containing protein [Baekduia sp.]|nr:cupin domain-containing protein [Baekduia sp.]